MFNQNIVYNNERTPLRDSFSRFKIKKLYFSKSEQKIEEKYIST